MTAGAEPARRVSDRVHERLREEILEGHRGPGDPLPSERALAEELRVNRHAVREALKRLEQAGLVSISHGGATRVLDWRDSGGLEVLLDLVRGSGGPPSLELTRSVLEMRATVGVDAARRCALRGSDAARADIGRLAERTAAAVCASDRAAVDELYPTLWEAVVAGSGNIAYRLALNSLVAAVAAHAEIADALRPTDATGIRKLGEAVAAADADASGRAAGRLLEPDVGALG